MLTNLALDPYINLLLYSIFFIGFILAYGGGSANNLNNENNLKDKDNLKNKIDLKKIKTSSKM